MAKSLMHIFRSGTQVSAAGESLAFSESDLAACAAAYDPAKHEAPICIGHPKNDMPAYGWIKGLSVERGDLLAERHQVDPAFAEMARKGQFKKVSAKFYRPDSPNNPVPGVWYLRHVAMLGAQPPAVKGLRQAEFSDTEEGVVEFADIEFSDPALGYIARMFRGLRDHLIETIGLEKADQVVPDWGITSVEEMGRDRSNPQSQPSLGTAFQEGARVPPTQEIDMTPEQIQQMQADLAAANKRATDATATVAAMTAANAKTKRDSRLADAEEFAEGLVKADQLLPRDKALVVSVLDALDGETPVEFDDGDGKKPASAALRELLKSMPKHALNGQHLATKRQGATALQDDPVALAHRAVEFQEAQRGKGITVTTAEAVSAVMASTT